MTFGDGAKGNMISSSLLKVPGMPKLENVLLMNGLKVNFISISQLCDKNLFVKFPKDKCSIIDITNTCYERKKIIRQLLYIDLFRNLLHHLVKQLMYLASKTRSHQS